MKIAKLTSLVISVAVLSACGGGGGAGGGSGTAVTPDGDKINLTLSPNGFVGGKTTYGEFKGQNNDSSFYGVWINDAKTLRELRFQGTEATNLPRGSATYIGDAIWAGNIIGDIHKGGSTLLNVDFDNKTVSGKISFSLLNDGRPSDITLHTTNLSGTSFQGKASVKNLIRQADGIYKGGLFGNEATEAAGIVTFQGNSDLDTSFGGKRQ